MARAAAGLLLAAGATAACGTGGDRAVIEVPRDEPTVQRAVDRAAPGTLVLVSPGVYREQVRVRTPRVVLRGRDRAGVVIDGGLTRPNGIVVTAPGVAVENLTVRGALFTGLLFTGVTDAAQQRAGGGDLDYARLDPARFPPLEGFRASHVTAHANGMSGIYAFDARAGVIEHSAASGHPDSGIYVGRCRPCDVLVRDSVAERNAVGIEVTNASGGVHVLANRVTGNRVGITVNSEALESLAPQRGAVVAGNTVAANAAPDTPAQADGGFGTGIGIGGGSGNLVTRNLITGHPRAGVLVAAHQGFQPRDNRITGNVLRGNAAALVSLAPAARNLFDAPLDRRRAVAVPAGVPFDRVRPLGPQPGLPVNAPVRPAVGLPGPVDAAAVPLPRSAR